jgi:heptosyltransferase II
LNIFIEIPTWLGDAVMTTPAIENIIQKYPESQLTIFGSFVSTKLFKYHPNVVKIIVDESRKSGNRYINLFQYAKNSGNYNIALSFRKNFTSKFLLFFIDAKEKYIYKRFDKELVTHQVIRYNQFIQDVLDISTDPGTLKIYTKQEMQKEARPVLGLNPGATYGSAKRWYPNEFAKVAIALSFKFDIKIFGGPNEKDIAYDIEQLLQEANVTNYINLAGKTSIEELIENIALLDLFITNDSGPMHVAAAFSIPTVSIFGPTRFKETSQWQNPNSILIREELDCSPCMKRTCPLKHHDCMKLITAETVLEKLKENHFI